MEANVELKNGNRLIIERVKTNPEKHEFMILKHNNVVIRQEFNPLDFIIPCLVELGSVVLKEQLELKENIYDTEKQ